MPLGLSFDASIAKTVCQLFKNRGGWIDSGGRFFIHETPAFDFAKAYSRNRFPLISSGSLEPTSVSLPQEKPVDRQGTESALGWISGVTAWCEQLRGNALRGLSCTALVAGSLSAIHLTGDKLRLLNCSDFITISHARDSAG